MRKRPANIAEINHVIETDFREGNTSPKTENLEFIKKYQESLPQGVKIKYLRIDCAGYQKSIIQYCDEKEIHFAIRAMMSKSMRTYINTLDETQWEPIVKPDGYESTMCSHRTTHRISDYSDSEIIKWYGARAEKSENKIKELMLDFGGAHMPCGQFAANALYFSICTLSYNLFVMLRNHLPDEFKKSRAKAVRLRVYGMAAKLIKHSRQFKLKLQKFNNNLLSQIINKIKQHQFHPNLE